MVKSRFIHSLAASLGILGVCSCGSSDAPVVPEPEQAMVNLTFSIAPLATPDGAASRGSLVLEPDENNYFQQGTEFENYIRTIHIIIVRPNAEVEHSVSFNFEPSGTGFIEEMKFAVVPDEDKRIYLLANCADLGYDFSTIREGGYYTSSMIENAVLHADAANVLMNNTGAGQKYLPMTEVHTVHVNKPSPGEDMTQDIGTLFVTRAAVKLSFSISADNGNGLYLKKIAFDGLADREYLLPRETTYVPPKAQIDTWLTNLADSPVDPGLEGRFIQAYTIPPGAEHHVQEFVLAAPIALSPTSAVVNFTPEVYFCESKMIDLADIANPYKVSITVGTHGTTDNDYTFAPTALPNLPTLPRNTHVKVNMRLTGTDVNCNVQIMPYVGVWLDPIFGLDPPKKEGEDGNG